MPRAFARFAPTGTGTLLNERGQLDRQPSYVMAIRLHAVVRTFQATDRGSHDATRPHRSFRVGMPTARSRIHRQAPRSLDAAHRRRATSKSAPSPTMPPRGWMGLAAPTELRGEPQVIPGIDLNDRETAGLPRRPRPERFHRRARWVGRGRGSPFGAGPTSAQRAGSALTEIAAELATQSADHFGHGMPTPPRSSVRARPREWPAWRAASAR